MYIFVKLNNYQVELYMLYQFGVMFTLVSFQPLFQPITELAFVFTILYKIENYIKLIVLRFIHGF